MKTCLQTLFQIMTIYSFYEDMTETSIFHYNWNDGESWLAGPSLTPTDPDKFLDRASRNGKSISTQNGAFKVLNEEGQYYVYGLPAYNTTEVEAAFSVNSSLIENPGQDELSTYVDIETESGDVKYKYSGTDKFLSKQTKPPYAHSYMLTSILGADYVDIDDNGPSDEDLGYWVKIDYVRYANDYKWRAPYAGANYAEGALTSGSDDKGSYLYGEKELWYVSRIETKTHVLVFDLAERNDNHESAGEIHNYNWR